MTTLVRGCTTLPGPGQGRRCLAFRPARERTGPQSAGRTAFLGEPQIVEGIADIGSNGLPVEPGIGIRQIGATLVAQPVGGSRLDELVIEPGQLLRIVRVGQLPDQIGGADQTRLGVRLLVVAASFVWAGKAGFSAPNVRR